MRYLIIFLFISQTSIAAETLLHCEFKYGDKVGPRIQNETFGPGDMEDVYLKIDFEREKVIESPFVVYGTFGSKTKILFNGSEVTWTGKNKYIRLVAVLDRSTGELRSVYNKLDGSDTSGEENYICKKSRLRF